MPTPPIIVGPIITTLSLPTGTVGTLYTATIIATGGTTPYVWSLVSGSLQTGLTLVSNPTFASIQGTPTQSGANNIQIRVTDNQGYFYTQSYTLTINPGSALTITTGSPLTPATVNTPYTFTMAATGGTPPYTWSLVSSTGSNTWSISSGGIISGTPTVVETDTLSIKVTDSTTPTPNTQQGVFSLSVSSVVVGSSLLTLGATFSPGDQNIPLWKNRVRDSRGFTVPNGSAVLNNLDSNGWPASDFSCLLFEGLASPVSGQWAYGTYNCGYISKGNGPATVPGIYTSTTGGTEVISIIYAGSIPTINYNPSTKAVTFQWNVTGTPSAGGIQITGTTGGITNFYAYLPGYTPGKTFDYYVSPTGSDSNPGTVASPWAITSLMNRAINANNQTNFNKTTGKRIGFLPGTYNVSTYMQSDSFTGAFQIDGGTAGNPTYYGSCDASGQYSVGTATITALTSGGLPGGGLSWPSNGPILGGLTNTPHKGGYVTIDGLRFTAFTYKAIRLGGVSSGDGPAITGNVYIQNCEFYGQFQQAAATVDNFACIWLDGTATVAAGGTGIYVITNNYFHDNIGVNAAGEIHLCSIFIFNCANVQITYNTGTNSGTLAWGKDSKNQGTTVAYNYIDTTALSNGPELYGFNDFTGAYGGTTGLTLISNFHHNVVITDGWGFGLRGAASNEAWQTPVNIYSNTIVMSGSPYPAIWANSRSGDANAVKIYNNILTGAADGSGYKHISTGALALSICDYNGEPSGTMSWRLMAQGDGNTTVATYTTASSFATGVTANGGVSGCETHSVSNSSPQFTGVNTGQLSSKYQLLSGSPFKNVGSTTGLSSGTACDMGAWGYDPALGASPFQIGYILPISTGVDQPDANGIFPPSSFIPASITYLSKFAYIRDMPTANAPNNTMITTSANRKNSFNCQVSNGAFYSPYLLWTTTPLQNSTSGIANAFYGPPGVYGFTANSLQNISSSAQNTSTGVWTTATQNPPYVPDMAVKIQGTAPGGFNTTTTYYVLATGLTTTTVELSATQGGTVLIPSSSSACTIAPASIPDINAGSNALPFMWFGTVTQAALNAWFANPAGGVTITWSPLQQAAGARSGYSMEGRPMEWALSMAIAANVGWWHNTPPLEDGTTPINYGPGSYTTDMFNLVKTVRAGSYGWTGTHYIEHSNEVWNYNFYSCYLWYRDAYTMGQSTSSSQILSDGNPQYIPAYYSRRLRQIYNIGQSITPGTWGTTTKLICAYRGTKDNVFQTETPAVFSQMVLDGYTPSNIIAWPSFSYYNVPYITPTTSITNAVSSGVNTILTVNFTGSGGSNPFGPGGQPSGLGSFVISGIVGGMSQLNGLTVQPLASPAPGGSSGAWTCVIPVNSSTYGTYGSGGQIAMTDSLLAAAVSAYADNMLTMQDTFKPPPSAPEWNFIQSATYKLPLNAYEGGLQYDISSPTGVTYPYVSTNVNSTDGGIITATAQDSVFTSAYQNYLNSMANLGYTSFTQYSADCTNGAYPGGEAVVTSQQAYAFSSPMLTAISNLTTNAPTYTRNVVTSGVTIPGYSYADNVGTGLPTFASNQYGPYYGNPYFNKITYGNGTIALSPVGGRVGYRVYVPTAGTFSFYITATLSSSTSYITDVIVSTAATGPTTQVLSKTVTGMSTTPTEALIGTITLIQGHNAIVIGTASAQANVTINQLRFV